ncbi:MAG: hypothetical protein OEZ32_01130 [Nitrospinota bacterium]|nr:hypothetical protein [Nitrospinota bacterium]
MEKQNKTSYLAPLFAALGIAVMTGLFAGCGDITIDTGQLGLGDNSNDLSNIGLSPDPSWHNSYLVGAHGSFACGDCHASTARTGASSPLLREMSGDQICARCHMGDYNRTSLFNHGAYKIGTHCNSCHYSDNFKYHTRPSHNKYHEKISSSCVACHPGKTPGGHLADGRTGLCEMCHKYPNWQGTGFSHSGVTSGCSNCHSKHYSGFPCESCHTFGISWGFSHSRVRSDGCPACHGSDGHGGGGHDD